jgi:hypothetical protein
LHGILGFVQGAKHAVAMHFDFAAERFGKSFKRLVCTPQSLLRTSLPGRCHGFPH